MKAEVQLNLSLHFAKVGPAAVIDLEKQVNYWRDGSDEDCEELKEWLKSLF